MANPGSGQTSLWLPATVPRERLGRAVHAYCLELCGPRAANAAAAESLECFGSASIDPSEPDRETLRLTRTVAARHAAAVRSPAGWRTRLAAERDNGCSAAADGLAARANGELEADQQAQLDEHLSGCLACRAIEVRQSRAERAFSVLIDSVPAADAVVEPPMVERAGFEPPPGFERAGFEPPPVEPLPVATAAAAAEDQPPVRGARRRKLGLVSGAAALAAAVLVALLVLLSGGSGKRTGTAVHPSASAPTPSPSAVSVATPRRAPSKHRHSARHQRHKAAPNVGSTGSSAVTSPATTGSSASGVAPSAPVASSTPPASSPPPTSTPSSSGSSPSSRSVSISQQGSSLSAQSAPTRPIGSGGSPNKH